MARQPVVGVLQVACRACRALAGRPCVDARGYLAERPHGRRLLDWRDLETRDAAAALAQGAPPRAGSQNRP